MSKVQIDEVINALKGLDLSMYPEEEIKRLIPYFGKVVIIEYNLHPGKTILRARPEDDQWPYTTRSSHCYKPQQFNKTYQRASTPNQTMFYGSMIPEELDQGDLDSERLIVSREASLWLRDDNTCGVKRITYSKWEVTSDIKLIAILQHKEFYHASSLTRKVVNDFHQFIKNHPDYEESSILVSDYMAHEFGKEVTGEDYNYMITAIYTSYILSKGFDGVMYPSVRVDGQGFNIAITPEAADQKLKLIAAGECTLYKRFKETLIDNDTIAIIEDEQQPIQYQSIEAKYHTGEAKALAAFGVKTKDELCDGR